MSLRAQRLHEAADSQVAQLAELLAGLGDAGLRRPCPGRARLGDGSVAAVALLTTGSYEQIAEFVTAARTGTAPRRADRHRELHSATTTTVDALVARLAATREALTRIAELSDDELDSVPDAGDMKFADGSRMFEQIIASLLRHQRHQVDALTAAAAA
jgi:hypothetical protein